MEVEKQWNFRHVVLQYLGRLNGCIFRVKKVISCLLWLLRVSLLLTNIWCCLKMCLYACSSLAVLWERVRVHLLCFGLRAPPPKRGECARNCHQT